jgi:hypothetical protein
MTTSRNAPHRAARLEVDLAVVVGGDDPNLGTCVLVAGDHHSAERIIDAVGRLPLARRCLPFVFAAEPEASSLHRRQIASTFAA